MTYQFTEAQLETAKTYALTERAFNQSWTLLRKARDNRRIGKVAMGSAIASAERLFSEARATLRLQSAVLDAAIKESGLSPVASWDGGNAFHDATKAHFTPCPKPEGDADFVSESGSEYWNLPDGVVRHSDHWGANIRSCDWFLSDDADAESWRTGFCSWKDFVFKHKVRDELIQEGKVLAFASQDGKIYRDRLGWVEVVGRIGKDCYLAFRGDFFGVSTKKEAAERFAGLRGVFKN